MDHKAEPKSGLLLHKTMIVLTAFCLRGTSVEILYRNLKAAKSVHTTFNSAARELSLPTLEVRKSPVFFQSCKLEKAAVDVVLCGKTCNAGVFSAADPAELACG